MITCDSITIVGRVQVMAADTAVRSIHARTPYTDYKLNEDVQSSTLGDHTHGMIKLSEEHYALNDHMVQTAP